MKHVASKLFLAAALTAGAVGAAQAHVNIGVSLGVPAPVGYYEPAPIYAPRPIYVEPAYGYYGYGGYRGGYRDGYGYGHRGWDHGHGGYHGRR